MAFSFMGGGKGRLSPTPVLEKWAETSGGDADIASLDCVAPTGIMANDSLIILVAGFRNIGCVFGGVVPSGWTFRGYTPTDSTMGIGLFYKQTATGSEGTVTITPDNSARLVGTYMRISSTSQTTFVDVDNYAETGTSATSVDIPAVTTTTDNCLVLAAASQSGATTSGITVSGTGWTKADDVAAGSGSGDAITTCFAYKTQTTAGSSGICTIDFNTYSSDISYFQFAIRAR